MYKVPNFNEWADIQNYGATVLQLGALVEFIYKADARLHPCDGRGILKGYERRVPVSGDMVGLIIGHCSIDCCAIVLIGEQFFLLHYESLRRVSPLPT